MVHICCVKKCRNTRTTKYGTTDGHSSISSGISLHRFPWSKPEIFDLWVQAINRDKWKPTKSSRLCSAHFKPENFYPNPSGRFLREDAVPTIFGHQPMVKKEPLLEIEENNLEVKQENLEVKAESLEVIPDNLEVKAESLEVISENSNAKAENLEMKSTTAKDEKVVVYILPIVMIASTPNPSTTT